MLIKTIYNWAQPKLCGYVWLSLWSDKNSSANNINEYVNIESVSYYLIGYAMFGLAEIVIKLCCDLTYYHKCAGASRSIHKNLLNNVMRSPMKFFDTNPTGRILNRFTSDLDTIDANIPFELADFSFCFVECLSVIILISIVTPGNNWIYAI